MNRAERRAKQRSVANYDRRQTFSKSEVERMNERSYELGIQHTLQAMKTSLGIGPKRMSRVRVELGKIQYRDFTEYFQDVKGNNN